MVTSRASKIVLFYGSFVKVVSFMLVDIYLSNLSIDLYLHTYLYFILLFDASENGVIL